MPATTPPLLVFAAICFVVAALVFLVVIAPGLTWRARRLSWRGWLIFGGAAAGVAAFYVHLLRIVLR